jgi:hypothetical protein
MLINIKLIARMFTKSVSVIVVVATVVMIASVNLAFAGHHHGSVGGSLGTITGTIDSIQNGGNGEPVWILSGVWVLKAESSVNPTFNSTFHMIMLNGTEPHMHTIKTQNLLFTSEPTECYGYTAIASCLDGTATITMKGISISDVPIAIKLFPSSHVGTTGIVHTIYVMNLRIDPTKIMNHFGNTPIYGIALRS